MNIVKMYGHKDILCSHIISSFNIFFYTITSPFYFPPSFQALFKHRREIFILITGIWKRKKHVIDYKNKIKSVIGIVINIAVLILLR